MFAPDDRGGGYRSLFGPSDSGRRNGRRHLLRREVPDGAAVEIQLDRPDRVSSRDQVHATGQRADDVDAAVLWKVLLVAVTEGDDARLPASPVVATQERPG